MFEFILELRFEFRFDAIFEGRLELTVGTVFQLLISGLELVATVLFTVKAIKLGATVATVNGLQLGGLLLALGRV